jgi:hypothetical protein
MTHGNARRELRQATLHLHAAPERVFPLLCPVREHDWLPGWQARIVFTESGFAEKGCVFTTTGDQGNEAVWTVSRHEPGQGVVEFVVVVGGLYVTVLDIALHREADGTRVEWQRTYTPLSEAGERAIASITPEGFAAYLGRLEAQLDHYLATGEALHL